LTNDHSSKCLVSLLRFLDVKSPHTENTRLRKLVKQDLFFSVCYRLYLS